MIIEPLDSTSYSEPQLDDLDQRLRRVCSYASRGWEIVPLHERSKRPDNTAAPHAVYCSTADLGRIQAWFDACPTRNWGIRTGPESNNLLVLDFDDMAFFDEAQDALDLPMPMVQTTGKGRHLFASLDSGALPKGKHHFRGALDVQFEGRYVVADPSIHPSGMPYVMCGDELPTISDDLPKEVLLMAAQWCREHGRHGDSSRSGTKCGSLVGGAERRIIDVLAYGCDIGERMVQIRRCFSSFVAVGFPPDRVKELLLACLEVSDTSDGEWDAQRLIEMVDVEYLSLRKQIFSDPAFAYNPRRAAWANTHWDPAKIERYRSNPRTREVRRAEVIELLNKYDVPLSCSRKRVRDYVPKNVPLCETKLLGEASDLRQSSYRPR